MPTIVISLLASKTNPTKKTELKKHRTAPRTKLVKKKTMNTEFELPNTSNYYNNSEYKDKPIPIQALEKMIINVDNFDSSNIKKFKKEVDDLIVLYNIVNEKCLQNLAASLINKKTSNIIKTTIIDDLKTYKMLCNVDNLFLILNRRYHQDSTAFIQNLLTKQKNFKLDELEKISTFEELYLDNTNETIMIQKLIQEAVNLFANELN